MPDTSSAVRSCTPCLSALLARRFLSRAEAAAYVGVGETTFEEEVTAGLWPPPLRRGAKGTRLTWDRLALDAAADRLSGLQPACHAAAPGGMDDRAAMAAAAEAAALGRVNNAKAKDRSKQRNAQAV